jgi:NAD(P)-dependent dehydrogenase (short-subunit alcohol dehydrogenase family)
VPTQKYGATTMAAEIVADVDLRGRRAIVTGASSGIGVETPRALASTGADITLAVRNVEAGKTAADDIAKSFRPGRAPFRSRRSTLPIPSRWPDSCARGQDRR